MIMDISTLYVGQGALAIVRNGGEAIVVDSLLPGAEEDRAAVEANINRLLKNHDVVGLILTGFDSDHCSADGLDLILSTYEPNWIMYPKYYKDTDTASAAFRLIRKHEKKRAESSRPLQTVSVRLDQMGGRILKGLSKSFEYELFSPHMEDMDNSNNSSIVIKLTGVGTSGFSYLITGDTETDRWDTINRLFGKSIQADVLAAPHHGAKSGANAKTMLLVEPNTVLISAGVDSQYGHPHGQALQAYQRVATHVHATNIEDGVSLYTKKNGTDFETKLFR
jgi:competence protein ComEC